MESKVRYVAEDYSRLNKAYVRWTSHAPVCLLGSDLLDYYRSGLLVEGGCIAASLCGV
jgi:hypothetical protein